MKFSLSFVILLWPIGVSAQTQLTHLTGKDGERQSKVFSAFESEKRSAYLVDSAKVLQLWEHKAGKPSKKLCDIITLKTPALTTRRYAIGTLKFTGSRYYASVSNYSKQLDALTFRIDTLGNVDVLKGADVHSYYRVADHKIYYLKEENPSEFGLYVLPDTSNTPQRLHGFTNASKKRGPYIQTYTDSLVFVSHYNEQTEYLGFVYDLDQNKEFTLEWKGEGFLPQTFIATPNGNYLRGVSLSGTLLFQYKGDGNLDAVISKPGIGVELKYDSFKTYAVARSSTGAHTLKERLGTSAWTTKQTYSNPNTAVHLYNTRHAVIIRYNGGSYSCSIYNTSTDSEFLYKKSNDMASPFYMEEIGDETFFSIFDQVVRTNGTALGTRAISEPAWFTYPIINKKDSQLFIQAYSGAFSTRQFNYYIVSQDTCVKVGKGRRGFVMDFTDTAVLVAQHFSTFNNGLPQMDSSCVVERSYSVGKAPSLVKKLYLNNVRRPSFQPSRHYAGSTWAYFLAGDSIFYSNGKKGTSQFLPAPNDTNGFRTLTGYKDNMYLVTMPGSLIEGYTFGYDKAYQINPNLGTYTPLGRLMLGTSYDGLSENYDFTYQASATRLYSSFAANLPFLDSGIAFLDSTGTLGKVSDSAFNCLYSASATQMHYHNVYHGNSYVYDEGADSNILLLSGKEHKTHIENFFSNKDSVLVFVNDSLSKIPEAYLLSNSKATLVKGSIGLSSGFFHKEDNTLRVDFGVRAGSSLFFTGMLKGSVDVYTLNTKTLEVKKARASDSISSLIGTFKNGKNALAFGHPTPANRLPLYSLDFTGNITTIAHLPDGARNMTEALLLTLDSFGTACQGSFYFPYRTQEEGTEIWRTDGTAKGTHLFARIQKGPKSSAPYHLSAINEHLLFIANDAQEYRQLYSVPLSHPIVDVDISKLCVNDSLRVINRTTLGKGSIQDFTWYLNTDSIQGRNPVISAFDSAGIYPLVLRTRYGTGQTSFDSFEVEVNQVTFKLQGSTLVKNGNIYPYTASDSTLNYEWVLTGGTFNGDSTGHNVSVLWNILAPTHQLRAIGADAFCEDADTLDVFFNVGVDPTEPSGFSVHPNPATTTIQIGSLEDTSARLEIVSLKGEVLATHLVAPFSRINVSGLSKGIYLLRLSTDNGPVHELFEKL